MNSEIKKLISGVHMGLGHDGLRKLLRKPTAMGGANTDLDTLAGGDLIMCINSAGDKLKVIGCKGLVIGYLKMPKGRRIMLEALQYIPQTFGGGGFNYDAACKKALLSKLAKRELSPLDLGRAKKDAGL